MTMRRHQVAGRGTTGWWLPTAAAFALAAPAPAAPSSGTCEFAVAGWIATQIELQEARRSYRSCRQEARRACTAEEGRVQSLEQRLRLLRNYLDGYCRR